MDGCLYGGDEQPLSIRCRYLGCQANDEQHRQQEHSPASKK